MNDSNILASEAEFITTKEEAKKINAINKDVVHKICSGQVILNLGTAVKELVENSLDAGATNIEVRLKEYGEELLEVLDNGSGVTEDNFTGLTLKYHTSKLRDFADLLGVSTFGFRGEALSSLCALGNMTITTRHNSSHLGTKLVFDHKGVIISRSPCARQPGTTVSLHNLFNSLPVRQKEFHKNIKREFNKMTQLLYAYCLVAEGVKIICTNQVNKGQKSVVVSTQGGSVQDNIGCVFGNKQAQSLLDLTPVYPEYSVENIKENFFNQLENGNKDGFQQKEQENKTDVDVSSVDNELDLSEDSNELPDVILSSQEQSSASSGLLSQTSSQFSNSVKKPFDFHGYISSCSHGSGRSSKDRQFFYINSRPCEPQKVMKIINEIYKSYNPHQAPFVYLNIKMKKSSIDVNVTPDKRKLFFDKEKALLEIIKTSLNKLYENIPSTLKLENTKSHNRIHTVEENNSQTPRIFTSFLSQFSKEKSNINDSCGYTESTKTSSDSKRKATSTLDNYVSKISRISPVDEAESAKDCEDESVDTSIQDEVSVKVEMDDSAAQPKEYTAVKKNTEEQSESVENVKDPPKETVFLSFSDNVPVSPVVDINDVISECIENKTESKKTPIKKKTSFIVDSELEKINVDRKIVKINVTLEDVKIQMFENYRINVDSKQSLQRVKFRTKIDPVSNRECEEELKKEINKDMFSQMKIIGQFNLGFIITQLDNDLFIIDQHATDEKYNFETLQKSTVLTNQKLVVPQPLELTSLNEKILMDNLQVFNFNGFTFQIDESAPPTKKIKLVTIPTSKGTVFGKEDIDELLFMLQDYPTEMCRPSRVRSMFASRACRKSVMIGTALSKSDMRRLVDHMGIIDQPWNCPHGRPTIRHLINLALTQMLE